jgi:sterol desaturase/sphingolipid hydroxylase (fatty acid hydroxylase superfamily)
VLLEISLVIVGFFFTSVMFYLNHRFVGHGPLGKWPLLHHMKRLHLIHHKNDYNEKRNDHLILPFWSKISFLLVFVLVSIASIPFAVGYISYVFYYSLVHYKIHNGDLESSCGQHHYIHHRKSIKHNFSGTMPFIDKVFGTYYKKALTRG